jgi:hypothetical protein
MCSYICVEYLHAQIHIHIYIYIYNAGSTLTINGEPSANYPLTATWSVTDSSGFNVDFTALTPLVRNK